MHQAPIVHQHLALLTVWISTQRLSSFPRLNGFELYPGLAAVFPIYISRILDVIWLNNHQPVQSANTRCENFSCAWNKGTTKKLGESIQAKYNQTSSSTSCATQVSTYH